MRRRLLVVAVLGMTGCSPLSGATTTPTPAVASPSAAVSSPVPTPSAGGPPVGPSAAPSANPGGPERAVDSYPSAPSSGFSAAVGNGVFGNALLLTGSSTWYWDGTQWHHSNSGFAGDGGTAPVFDPALGKSVALAGGQTGDPVTTWLWNGTGWSALYAPIPSEAEIPQLGYDTATKQLLALVTTTWVFDGTQWQHAGGLESPLGRLNAGLAFDPGTQQLVLFGGVAHQSRASLADTWTWDGKAWTQRHPSTSPPGGWDSLAYDPDAHQLILVNEHLAGDGLTPDEISMWTWDGTEWHKLSPQRMPAMGIRASLTFDTADHQLLLYEGTFGTSGSQTWSYANDTWTRVG